ncbi:MAG: Clp protease ClpP [Rhizobiales bacterium]|nr:Clp protease ClpP [Hyphomicrobiales bacterium]
MHRLPLILMNNVTLLHAKKAHGQYRMLNKSKDRGEIWLYGIIGMDWFGDGVTAKQFADDLKKLGAVKTIDLRINSDGGVVTDARAMYNLLVEHSADVLVHIDGIAASAASFVAMAGKEIDIAEGGFVMIHNARGATFGEAEDHRRIADVLDSMNKTIRETYAARTSNSDQQLKTWMDAETWFDGKDAVKHRFADRIVENMKVAAALTHPEWFKHPPSVLLPKRAAAAARIAALRRS